MCSRYFIDDGTGKEIEKLTEQINQGAKNQRAINQKTINQKAINQETENQRAINQETENQRTINQKAINQETENQRAINQEAENQCHSQNFAGFFIARDIHPTDMAPILTADQGHICCKLQKWGFPGFGANGKNSNYQIVFNARSESALEKPMFHDSISSRRIVIPAAYFYEWNKEKEKNTFYKKDCPILLMAGCCQNYNGIDCFVILTTAANASMQSVHDRMPLILEQDEAAEWILNDLKTADFLQKTPCLLERRTEYEQMKLF